MSTVNRKVYYVLSIELVSKYFRFKFSMDLGSRSATLLSIISKQNDLSLLNNII